MKLTNQKDWIYKNVRFGSYKQTPLWLRHIIRYFPNEDHLDYLEIGCEPGTVTNFIAYVRNYNFYGIDFVNTSFFQNELSKKFPQKNFRKITGDFIESTILIDKKFDIVCSFGFIEHFKNTQTVVERHKSYLNTQSGILIYSMPNFTGIFGHYQRFFCPHSFSLHELNAMDLKDNCRILNSLGFEIIDFGYCGGFEFWGYERKTGSFIKYIFYLLIRIFSKYIFSFNFGKKVPQSFIYFIARVR